MSDQSFLIDTHGHLNLEAYEEDRDQVIQRIEEAEMKVIVPGVDFVSSRLAWELSQKYASIYPAVGVHPGDASPEEFDTFDFQQLINQGGVVAIGECGLDYFRLPEDLTERQKVKQQQLQLFQEQIKLALANDLPLIIHCRNDEAEPAHQEVFRLLQEHQVSRAVWHCFGGTLEEAKKFTEAGYYIGITGIITFDKTGVLEQIVKEVPFESLLIETDAPLLAPEPYRGKRNEPIYVIEVAKKIAEIKEISLEEVIEQTWNNAVELFKI
ncbi:MAG: TatD family hydrolase [Candidatus Komeilibacteria bacterium]